MLVLSFNLILQIQLQQFVDPEVPPEMKRNCSVTRGVVTTRKVKWVQTGYGGKLRAFYCLFLFILLFLSSVTEPCSSLLLELFSRPVRRQMFPVEGTGYCRSTLVGKTECLHFPSHTYILLGPCS